MTTSHFENHLKSSSPSSAPAHDTSQSGDPLTPAVTPSETPPQSIDTSKTVSLDLNALSESAVMDKTETSPVNEEVEATPAEVGSSAKQELKLSGKKVCTKKGCKSKHKKRAKKGKKKVISPDESSSESSDSSSESEEDESSDSSSSSEESEIEGGNLKQKKKLRKALVEKKKKLKARQKSKGHKKVETESESDDSSDEDTESEAESEDEKPLKSKKKKSKKAKRSPVVSDDESDDEDDKATMKAQIKQLQADVAAQSLKVKRKGKGKSSSKKSKKAKKQKRASKVEYKRVDQLWDTQIHNYKLTDTAEDEDADEYDQYIFTVRRKFNWENKYDSTVVDIKSSQLKEMLNEIMDGVKGVSLVEDTPTVDPNMLFLYLEEMRALMKSLKLKLRKSKKLKKKERKQISLKVAHMKVFIKYLDTDFSDTKKTLYPMLESGLINFDLLWALFKPNTIAYTTTYGSVDQPRAFKVESATKECSFMRGTWYVIEGRYLEYDGKSFGMGQMQVEVDAFKGARKITLLNVYPLKYHKDQEDLKKSLIERGRKFVDLKGSNYRFHNSLAYYKKKKSIIKVNINGRIMIDPGLHRRINPNYPVSTVKPTDPDDLYSDSEDEDCSDDGCGCESGSENGDANGEKQEKRNKDGKNSITGGLGDEEVKQKTKIRVVWDDEGEAHYVKVRVDEEGEEVQEENIEELGEQDKEKEPEFTEEELMLASPVVLGFAFTEKLWLEFTVSGVRDIEWNEGAFDSLVLPDNQKSIVKALVESHHNHAAKNIDDVIQGKGKGLVAVLHGPPGTGKTLTAEGIAELLKRPLYMVSAGELGTDPRTLEAELNRILDIAHTWGAILLLDEADVFLEKRTIQDIHRNALVSIFLRLLEYFQGILFLTTNRVETFDEAFQSRIHVALRYGELTTKAKKSVWKMFLQKVKEKDGVETTTFTDADIDSLARNQLNGRQIKNAVRTAQALAVNVQQPLSMEHIKRVLDVAESFDHDLKGGTGYMDAMRSYT